MLRPMRMRAFLIVSALALLAAGCGASQGPSLDTAEQQVSLYHCGIQNIEYDGRQWEVDAPPFDATNAPDSFSGFGSFRRDGDVVTFTDREGVQLAFTPDDGTPDPYNCG